MILMVPEVEVRGLEGQLGAKHGQLGAKEGQLGAKEGQLGAGWPQRPSRLPSDPHPRLFGLTLKGQVVFDFCFVLTLKGQRGFCNVQKTAARFHQHFFSTSVSALRFWLHVCLTGGFDRELSQPEPSGPTNSFLRIELVFSFM